MLGSLGLQLGDGKWQPLPMLAEGIGFGKSAMDGFGPFSTAMGDPGRVAAMFCAPTAAMYAVAAAPEAATSLSCCARTSAASSCDIAIGGGRGGITTAVSKGF